MPGAARRSRGPGGVQVPRTRKFTNRRAVSEATLGQGAGGERHSAGPYDLRHHPLRADRPRLVERLEDGSARR